MVYSTGRCPSACFDIFLPSSGQTSVNAALNQAELNCLKSNVAQPKTRHVVGVKTKVKLNSICIIMNSNWAFEEQVQSGITFSRRLISPRINRGAL